MAKASINFQLLAAELQNYITSFVPRWIPGGKQVGHEYQASSIRGGSGSSFSINLNTGKWADFANPDHKGGDLISLYAAIYGVNNGKAAEELAEAIGFKSPEVVSEKLPNLISSRFGKPTKYWTYKNKRGIPQAIVVRYDPPNEKKQFSQWSFSNADQKWTPKAIPDNRPLYKLDQLDRNPSSKIVICEGEKAADAAQELFGDEYISTCWSGGAQALSKTDFSPLFNRDILLWPDADEPGTAAMSKLLKKIVMQSSSVKIITPKLEDEKGLDAADILEKGLQVDDFQTYLKDRIEIIKATPIETTSPVSSFQDKSPSLVGVALPYSEDQQEYDVLNDSRIMTKWQDLKLIMKTDTKVYQNESNIIKILSATGKTKELAYYDEFYKAYISTFKTTKPERFSDITFTRFKLYLQTAFGFGDISTSAVKESLRYYASGTIKNSVADYIKTLVWDGVPRINSFFTDIYGATLNDYSVAASRIFWLSMVARILEPGCKADIMIILEGMQGIQKTVSLEEIATIMDQCFYDVAGKDPTNKDFYIKLQGKFLIEMGEISTLLKTSDEDLKEMLSTKIDNYRVPYATEATPNTRTNVFVGTTNQTNYLRDDTGSRRFLPIKCLTADIDSLKRDKLQYYAEAVHRKLSGEDHWIFPKELAKEETDERMEIEDPWYDYVEEFVNCLKYVRTIDIMFHLQLEPKRQERKEANRISKILKKIGYISVKKRVNGEPSWIFEKQNIDGELSSWDKIDKLKRTLFVPQGYGT